MGVTLQLRLKSLGKTPVSKDLLNSLDNGIPISEAISFKNLPESPLGPTDFFTSNLLNKEYTTNGKSEENLKLESS